MTWYMSESISSCKLISLCNFQKEQNSLIRVDIRKLDLQVKSCDEGLHIKQNPAKSLNVLCVEQFNMKQFKVKYQLID